MAIHSVLAQGSEQSWRKGHQAGVRLTAAIPFMVRLEIARGATSPNTTSTPRAARAVDRSARHPRAATRPSTQKSGMSRCMKCGYQAIPPASSIAMIPNPYSAPRS